MADASNGGVAAASLSIPLTITSYQFFLPKLGEVRRAEPDDAYMRGDVYLGQLAAGATSVSVGAMLTLLTGSKVPLWTSVFVALIIAGVYQYALGNMTLGETP